MDEEGVVLFTAAEEMVFAVEGVLGRELEGFIGDELAVVGDGVAFEEVAGFAFGGGEGE